ncbi:MAG TPA: DUF177 domain-containing protein [Candidatus Saccharimonadales bacterium]|nr:DUF177 domain-containing protein [Candidatus Saccharimonadales bacterium]
MKIRIQDLEVRNLEFELQFQPGEIDFGSEVRQVGTLQTDGRAELIREHHGGTESIEDIRLVGKLDGRIEVSCARCLEPVEIPISRSFDLLYRPLASEKGSDEVAINEAETEIGYYKGEGMDLEDSLREQILLGVPIKTLCRYDCKGLCPSCGVNRNEQLCDCDQSKPDARWAALGDLKNKLH